MAKHAIQRKKQNRLHHGHDEASGLPFAIPAKRLSKIGPDERASDTNEAGYDNAARISTRHQKFCHRSNHQSDNKRPKDMHSFAPPSGISSCRLFDAIPPRTVFAIGRSRHPAPGDAVLLKCQNPVPRSSRPGAKTVSLALEKERAEASHREASLASTPRRY